MDTNLCMCLCSAISDQHYSLITLTALTWLIILQIKINFSINDFELEIKVLKLWSYYTRWRISNAYSKPAVKLATFSHFIALTASCISLILSAYARTYKKIESFFSVKCVYKIRIKVSGITILSLKQGTTDRVLSENAIKLTKSLSLSVSRMAYTVVMANSNDFPDIEPDASNKIIWKSFQWITMQFFHIQQQQHK